MIKRHKVLPGTLVRTRVANDHPFPCPHITEMTNGLQAQRNIMMPFIWLPTKEAF